jgi:hypothetical protein
MHDMKEGLCLKRLLQQQQLQQLNLVLHST